MDKNIHFKVIGVGENLKIKCITHRGFMPDIVSGGDYVTVILEDEKP